jgi:hypothetical protein
LSDLNKEKSLKIEELQHQVYSDIRKSKLAIQKKINSNYE